MKEKIESSVSIVILFKGENPYLFECLDRCLELDYNNYKIILLPDNEINERVSEYTKKYGSKIKVIPTGNLNIPKKRNIGVKNCLSEFIAFIDDDAFPKKDWLKNAIPFFLDPKIGAVGGPNLTPPNDPLIQRIAGNVMKSKLAFGEGYVRHKVCPQQFLNELPTCNLIVRKSLFNQLSFGEDLFTGEDTKLCSDIVKKNFKVLYSPNVVVFHHRRKIFFPLIKQFFHYGLYKSKLYKDRHTPSIYHIIPSLFFLFVVLGFIVSFIHPIAAITYIILMVIYFLRILFDAILNSSGIEIPLTWICIFIIQMSYGVGFILGYLFK